MVGGEQVDAATVTLTSTQTVVTTARVTSVVTSTGSGQLLIARGLGDIRALIAYDQDVFPSYRHPLTGS